MQILLHLQTDKQEKSREKHHTKPTASKIANNETTVATSKSSDVTVVEVSFRKSKWLLINPYKPLSMNNILFCEEMSSLIDIYSQDYKNIVTVGDFSMHTDNSTFRTFYEGHELYNLDKSKTCFKSNKGTLL